MGCKPDIETTKKMYDLYQQRYSLSQVGKAFGVSRQTVYERFKRRKLKMRTIQPLPFVMFEGKKYTRRANGYYAGTNGKRQFLHRAIWESKNGKIGKGWDIHHIDGDRANNVIENFELYTKSEHTKRFSTGNNQYGKKG